VIDYPDGFGPVRHPDAWDADVFGAMRRGWLVLLLAVLLGAGLGWGLGTLRAPRYTGSVEIRLQPLDGLPLTHASRSTEQQSAAMNTESESVTSGAVVRAVSRRLGLSRRDVAAAVRSRVVTNTNDLVIHYSASTPALARRGARVVGETFLGQRATAARDAALTEARRARAEVAAARQRLARTPKLRWQLIRYASHVAVFAPVVRELRTVDAGAGTVVAEPSLPSSTDALRSVRFAALGGATGLLLAAGALLWRDRREPRVRGDRLMSISGCPVLAVVPAEAGTDELVASNAHRVVRAAVLASSPRVLAVTPLTTDDGRAVEIVRVLARSLSGVAAYAAPLPIRNASSPFARQLGTRLRELSASHDVLLVATPAAEGPDGEMLAAAVGHVVLTVRDGETRIRRCRQMISRLRGRGATVHGIIVRGG
jgi:hypothetical protein